MHLHGLGAKAGEFFRRHHRDIGGVVQDKIIESWASLAGNWKAR